MTSDTPPSPTAPPSVPVQAPGNRVSTGFIVAVVVAVLMALGIIGLVAAALLGDDDEPTGAGLGPQVDVDAPATAPAGDASTTAGTDPAAGGPPAASATDAAASTPSGTAVPDGSNQSGSATGDAASPPVGDDDFSDDGDDATPPLSALPGVNQLDQPDGGDLPELADEPVVLPVQVTTPVPPSTLPAIPLHELGPDSVAALDGWSHHLRSDGYVSFLSDGELIEMFAIDGAASADEALERFDDDVRPDLEELTRSTVTRLGAPSARFVSVAGSEYTATRARQEGTSTMSGSIVAAVRPDGTAVVLATSRPGGSSRDELAADADLLTAVLAQL